MSNGLFSLRSSLGFVEERLRRALSLLGDVGLTFNPAATPVVIVDDVTRPGCNTTRGRHFSFQISSNVALAGSTWDAVRAINDVIIDRLILSYAENALPAVNPNAVVLGEFLPASVADPFAIATATGGSFTELALSSTDAPPLARGSSVVGFGAPSTLFRVLMWHGSVVTIEPKLFLRPGDKFAIRTTGTAAGAAAQFGISVFGRTF